MATMYRYHLPVNETGWTLAEACDARQFVRDAEQIEKARHGRRG